MQILLKLFHYFNNLIDVYNLHLVNTIFISFTLVILICGCLINLLESKLPTIIRQSYRYGKHQYKGNGDPLISKLEVPKAWFAHFYIFAFLWSLLAFYLVIKSILMQTVASSYILDFLDFVGGGRSHRQVLMTSNDALIATTLMTMQCVRRFYETNFIQIFSQKNRINLSHYIVGYVHYFGAITALLINTEGFVRDSLPSTFSLTKINIIQYISIIIFHYAWSQQWKANMILVNLRKDVKTGKTITEKHLLPVGGYFSLISSPHMFFEVVMYTALLGIIPGMLSWRLIVLWVFGNQIMNALLTHQWYKENFENYPKERKALIPFII